MKASLSTCLLLALLLPEVENLRCYTDDTGLAFCNTDDGLCFRHFYKGYINGSFIGEKKMGCALNCPSANYSFSASGEYFRNKINCCQTKLCNKKRTERASNALNGRCTFYYVSDPDDYPMLKNKFCRGHETRCIEFVLVHNGSSVPDKVYKGCATPSFCDMARKSPYIDKLKGTITEARCGDTLPDKGELNTEG